MESKEGLQGKLCFKGKWIVMILERFGEWREGYLRDLKIKGAENEYTRRKTFSWKEPQSLLLVRNPLYG